MSFTKKLYLINNGSTCKDMNDQIIEFYKKQKKNGLVLEKEDLNLLKKIRRDKNNKLSLNGIIECRELKKNKDMNLLKLGNNIFFSLCDKVSIETALIYMNKEKNPYLNLDILPLTKYENQIKKANDLTDFKNSFGSKIDNNMKNYWDIESNIITYKKGVNLNWTYLDQLNFSKIKSFSINDLKNHIENILIMHKTNPSKNIVLFCNQTIIKEYIKKVNNAKYFD